MIMLSRSARSLVFFFSSRRRHTRFKCDWSSDVCSSDLRVAVFWRNSGSNCHSIFSAHVPASSSSALPYPHLASAGSLPPNRSFPPATSSGEAFLIMDRMLDTARTGPLYLRQHDIAGMGVEALRYREQGLPHYRLPTYVLMANHVHVLVTPSVAVSKLMHSLKRYTAREGNRMLGVIVHPFWQDERYDRLGRDGQELQRIMH